MKINIKDRKLLMLFLGLIIVSFFTLTIAYAALSIVLTISGSATNDVFIVKSKHSLEFSTTLNMPGDFYFGVRPAIVISKNYF